MTLEITPDLILKLRGLGFYPDEMMSLLFVLKALETNEIEMLDNFDDLNTSKRAVILYQELFKKGYIERNKEGSATYFKLTAKGTEFLASLEPPKPEPVNLDWVDEWRVLFPSTNGKGKVLRSSVKDLKKNFEKFFKAYKYDKDIVFSATKAYLASEAGDNYAYTNENRYFIWDERKGSKLAAWCGNIKNEDGTVNDGSRAQLIQTVN